MNVYILEYCRYRFDDFDTEIKAASLDKNKVIEKLNKEKEFYIKFIKEHTEKCGESVFYQIAIDEPEYIEIYCGKWIYEYKIKEYELI